MTRLLHFLIVSALISPALAAPAQSTPAEENGAASTPRTQTRLGSQQFRAPDDLIYGALTPDGNILAVCSNRSVIYWFDTGTGKILHQATCGSRNYYDFSTYRIPTAPDLLYAPDGRRLFLFGHQNESKRFDFDPRKPDDTTVQRALKDANRPIALSRDCRFAAFFHHGAPVAKDSLEPTPPSRLTVLDLTSGKKKWEKQLPDTVDVQKVSLSSDGNLLALWQNGRALNLKDGEANPFCKIQIWDLAAGKEKLVLVADDDNIRRVCFSPDGALLISEGKGQFQIWETTSGKMLRRFTAHVHDEAMHMLFSPDSKKFAVGSRGEVQVWDVATGKRLLIRHGAVDELNLLHFCSDGRLLAGAFDGPTIHLWDATTGKSLLPEQPGHTGAIEALHFSKSGAMLSSIAADCQLIEWDVAIGNVLKSQTFDWKEPADYFARSRRNFYNGSKFSPNGKYAYCVESHRNRVGIFDLNKWNFIFDLDARYRGHEAIVFSPDARRFTTMYWEDNRKPAKVIVPVWDLDSNEMTHRFHLSDGSISGATFSTDGQLLALVHSKRNERNQITKTIWIANLSSGNNFVEVPTSGEYVETLRFLNERQLLVITNGHAKMTVLDGLTGAELRTFSGDPGPLLFDRAVVSRDQRLIAICSLSDKDRVQTGERDPYDSVKDGREGPTRVRIWEVVSGEVRHEFLSESEITALDFSPDGKTLASGLSDSTILLWDLVGRPSAPNPKADFQSLWKKLEARDAKEPEEAIRELVARADDTVSLMHAEMKPIIAAPMTKAKLDRLVVELGAPTFARRESARKELEKIGVPAIKEVEEALKAKPDADLQQRLDKLLVQLSRPDTGARHLRLVRAIEILERIGTREATALLRKMAEGDSAAKVTQDARASLIRLGNKD